MESFFDTEIAVLGAGPAGATFARLAGEKHALTVIDRRCLTNNETTPGKCCGGLLSPDAQRALASQGLTLPLDVLVSPQIFAVHVMDLPSGTQQAYSRSYVNLDRQKLDRWLVSCIPRHVPLLDQTVCLHISQDQQGRFLLRLKDRGGESSLLRARCLVGADGAASLVRRTFFPNRPIRQYVAVQELYQVDSLSPFFGALFDPRLTDCYGWLISKGQQLFLGAAFPKDRVSSRFTQLRQKLEQIGYRFGTRLAREGCLVSRPAGPFDFCTGSGRVLLLGEAAGFVSPSSLQGISYALDSGAILAETLDLGFHDPAAKYHRATLALRRQLLGKLLKCPFLYQPAIRRALMGSGIFSLPVSQAPAGLPWKCR